MPEKPAVGSVGWVDLTTAHADQLKDFYSAVIGWTSDSFDMGGYSDYAMNSPADGAGKAGICHARGANAGLPPVWLVYFVVANLEESVKRVTDLGGKILSGPRDAGAYGKFCVIEDPSGAACALHEMAAQDSGT